jgi:hypothetical protein
VSGGPEGGTDTLVSIEKRALSMVFSTSMSGIAAQIMRLYAPLWIVSPSGRSGRPDPRALVGGSDAAGRRRRSSSSEFKADIGPVRPAVRRAALSRLAGPAGDAAGLLSRSTPEQAGTNRAALVVALLQPEHRTPDTADLNAGLWIAGRNLQFSLQRDPRPAARRCRFGRHQQPLNGGTSLLQLAANFVESAGFEATIRGSVNQEFVEQLYPSS